MNKKAQTVLILVLSAAALPTAAQAQQSVAQLCVASNFPAGVTTLEGLQKVESPSPRRDTLENYLKCLQTGQQVPQSQLREFLENAAPSTAQPGAQNTSKPAPTESQTQSALTKAGNQSNFLGLNWGLGVGYAFGQGPKRVTATLVNNIVRVSSDVTNGPRVFLEAHYFPEKFAGKAGDFGWGPFAAVETGAAGATGSNGISGFGLGLMAGWRVQDNKSAGFNIGVGYLWEGNVQTLGDGIVANQPLPAGETQVRYKDQSLGAIAVMFSWTFGSSVPSSSSPST